MLDFLHNGYHKTFFDLQEVLLLEEDVKALEEMYPQGEKVINKT